MEQVEWCGRTPLYILLYLRNSNTWQYVPYLDHDLLFFTLSIYVFFSVSFLNCQYLEQFLTSVCILKIALFSHLWSFHSKFGVCLFLLIVIWNIFMSVSKDFSVISLIALWDRCVHSVFSGEQNSPVNMCCHFGRSYVCSHRKYYSKYLENISEPERYLSPGYIGK